MAVWSASVKVIRGWRVLLALLLAFSFSLSTICRSYAESTSDRRVKFGLTLFRSMLAADMNIMERKNEKGEFTILIVYGANRKAAERSLDFLGRAGESDVLTIKDIPISLKMVPIGELEREKGHNVAGIFLAEQLFSGDFASFVKFGVDGGLITYSPFEGDVEAGALGGLLVEAKVTPYINAKTMNKSGVKIKPFFLGVARTYE